MVEIVAPETIIWDLDGTMLDSFGIYSGIVTQLSGEWGMDIPTEDSLRHNFHGRLEDSIGNATGLVDGHLNTFVLEFLKVQEGYYEHPNEHMYEDALQLAQAGHAVGARQIIVTNREHKLRGKASPRYFVEHTLLRDIITHVITADTTEFRKPDKRVVISDLPVDYDPEKVLVVGDQHVDAELGRNLGATAVIVNRHIDPVPHLHTVERRATAIHVVESLTDVVLV